MIDFEITIPEETNVTPIKSTKTWYNVNDIKASEIKPFKKGYHPLNPFRLEDKVILHTCHHDRYGLIEGITSTMIGSVSEILGNNMVNISYWDTRPSTIKNVPVHSIKLADTRLSVKIRVFFKLLLRKIFNPNKLPKHIEEELKPYWKNL
jgi:hypothetical protein